MRPRCRDVHPRAPTHTKQRPGPAPASTLAKVDRRKKANVSLIFVCKYSFEGKGYCCSIKAGKAECIVKRHHNHLIIIHGFIKFFSRWETAGSCFDSGSKQGERPRVRLLQHSSASGALVRNRNKILENQWRGGGDTRVAFSPLLPHAVGKPPLPVIRALLRRKK